MKEKEGYQFLMNEVTIIDREQYEKIRNFTQSRHMIGPNDLLSWPCTIWELLIRKERADNPRNKNNNSDQNEPGRQWRYLAYKSSKSSLNCLPRHMAERVKNQISL